MRLTCPNCDAQYEVDDTAIPEDGRDVQCSNCGHAWFQLPPDVEARLRDEARAFGDEDTLATPAGSPEEEPAPGAEPPVAEPPVDEAPLSEPPIAEPPLSEPPPITTAEAAAPAWPPVPDEEIYDDDDDEAPLSAPRPTPSPRSLNDGLKQLLREEAERETTARRSEGVSIESQPDLGLDAPAPRVTTATHAETDAEGDDEIGSRIERILAGDEPEADKTGTGTPEVTDNGPEVGMAIAGKAEARKADRGKVDAARSRASIAAASFGDVPSTSRRDLLPDIEEINSTLRASTERERTGPGASTEAETPAEQRRSFRRGFVLVILIAVILALVYIYAPKIAQKVPALAGPLHSYVVTVDKGRIWLDQTMTRATQMIQGTSGSN